MPRVAAALELFYNRILLNNVYYWLSASGLSESGYVAVDRLPLPPTTIAGSTCHPQPALPL